MKKMTQLAVRKPGMIFTILTLLTIIAVAGMTRLKMDSSTESLLPRSSRAYRMLQQTKKIFGDSKTFHITAVEPLKGKKLLTPRLFSRLYPLMMMFREFRIFNKDLEETRFTTILKTVSVTPRAGKKAADTGNGSGPPAGLDDSPQTPAKTSDRDDPGPPRIDEPDSNTQQQTDIWKQKIDPKKLFARADRKRRQYDYSACTGVTPKALCAVLDKAAAEQMRTIIEISGFSTHPADKKLDTKQIRKIVENWETLYLNKSMQIIKTSIDPLTAKDVSGTGKSLKALPLIPEKDGKLQLPKDAASVKKYTSKLLLNPAYESLLYAKESTGKIAALAFSISLRPRENNNWIFNFFHQSIKHYNKSPFKLTQMGSFMYNKYLKEYMQKDLKRLIPLVILVIILTFYFNFRSKRGVILPMLSVLLAVTWTFGLMGILGIPITLVVNLLPPLLIAVGSSYAIHILNHYYLEHNEIHNAKDKKAALQRSMQSISVTVLLAAVTTFIGFMTLVTNQVLSLQHFGLFAALGTLFSMVSATLLIPASLTFLKKLKIKNPGKASGGQHSNKYVSGMVNWFSKLSTTHPRKLTITAILIVVVFGYGVSGLYVESSAAYMLKKDSFLYKADLHLGNLFKGHMVTNLVLDSGKKGGALEPAFLKFIEKFRRWAVSENNRKKYHILHTSSLGDLIKRFHMAANGDRKAFYRIPETRNEILDYLQLYGGRDSDLDGRPDSLESFMDPARRYINVLIRRGSQGDKVVSTRMNAAGQRAINSYLVKHAKPLGYTWESTGEPLTFVILGKMVIHGQITSVLLTLLLVAIMMILLFKNWISGLLAIIPISVSVIFIYGLMAFLKIPLDIPKAVLAAIAIGIGVDDTIHMLKTLRGQLKKGLPIKEALHTAHSRAGLAIVYTSVALILGFTVLLFSEFVPVFYLGLLVALAMLSTTLSALILLPAAAYLLNRFQLDREHDWKLLRRIKMSEYFDQDSGVD